MEAHRLDEAEPVEVEGVRVGGEHLRSEVGALAEILAYAPAAGHGSGLGLGLKLGLGLNLGLALGLALELALGSALGLA